MVAPAFTSQGVGGVVEEAPERIWEGRVGRIIGTDEQGRPLVDFEGNARGPRVARKVVPLDSGTLRSSIESGRPVELRFEEGDARLPIIIALSPSRAEPPAPVTASVDEGSAPLRIIEGQDELVLQCGKASITLRRNGKVIIKGTYVETHSEGVNRIKGGSVQFG
ncbi:hypothetical protein D7V97_30920 [Corallococcus sp. CA053C]|uniref:DUF6484 domain-containing protein n=1 Tax=Corallococcus sp. CA053C TaxID=2316732 RepID=UPI000EA037A8|nr:DUF6484 domain-containing protein [Corallococcus sp. CA053C]RKG99957.1 hypothetical protein D7V97_30920 [Corallococcus sp. CA053C]